MARIALLVCALFLLAGCGGNGEGSKEAAEPTVTSPTVTTSMTDRQFGYVRGFDISADPPTVTFDPAEALTGDAAQRAAEEDGVVAPGEPVPNDHYERNPEKEALVLEVAEVLEVTAAPPASYLMRFVPPRTRKRCAQDPRGVTCSRFGLAIGTFVEAVKQLDRYGIPMWVTTRDGVVVRLDEQYFP